MPPGNSTALYRLQIGAFKTSQPAVNAYERLRTGGLDPVYERYEDYRRVVLAGLRAGDISSYIARIRAVGFPEVWVREDISDERWRRVSSPSSGDDGNDSDFPTDTSGDFTNIHNIVVHVKEQGLLKVQSKVHKDGHNVIDFSYKDLLSGEEKNYSVNTADDFGDSSGGEVTRNIIWNMGEK